MKTRICTTCDRPHETTDFYIIEPTHPCAGQIECRPAHEDRVRRETRERLRVPTGDRFGYANSIMPPLKQLTT